MDALIGECEIGESRPCYPGNADQVGVGTCRAGIESCVGGAWSGCEGAIVPALEVCGDLMDNDCDQDKDNGCPCTYQRSTGFTASGSSVCCAAGQSLLSLVDCGSGNNHTVQQSGNCGIAIEGPSNGGSPCATITCQGKLKAGACQ